MARLLFRKKEATFSQDKAIEASLKYFGGDDLAGRVWINKYALKDSMAILFEKTPDDMPSTHCVWNTRIEKQHHQGTSPCIPCHPNPDNPSTLVTL